MTLTFILQLRLKVDKCFNVYFNSNNSDNISAVAFKLGMKADLCMGYYTQSSFDDLDLNARSHWLGRGNNSALNYFDNYISKQ